MKKCVWTSVLLLLSCLVWADEVDRKVLDYDFASKIYSRGGVPFSGTFVIKDSAGVVVKRVSLKDGKQDGDDIAYANGHMASRLHFKANIQDGKQYIYGLDTGKLARIDQYVNGKKEGVQQSFDADEKLESEYVYKQGKRAGFYKRYYPDGTVNISGFYEGYKKTGEWKWFNPDGSVSRTKAY